MASNFEDDDLKNQVNQVLRTFHLFPLNINLISGGRATVLYEVETQKGWYMVRLEPHYHNKTELTQIIMRDLSHRGIIPNQFIEIDISKKYLDCNVLITEKIPGTQFLKAINNHTLTDPEIKHILGAAIRNCSKISEHKTQGFGRIGRNFQAPSSSESAYIFESLNKFLENNQIQHRLGDSLITQIKKFFQKYEHLFDCTDPRLVYVDFHLRNIIIQDKEFRSLIDFDYFISGDPLVMYAHICFRLMENHPSLKEIFKNLLNENGIVQLKKIKLRLFTIWMAIVSLFFTVQGEIKATPPLIKNFSDSTIERKLKLLLDETYAFF